MDEAVEVERVLDAKGVAERTRANEAGGRKAESRVEQRERRGVGPTVKARDTLGPCPPEGRGPGPPSNCR